jgi:hypothetical protein
MSTDILEEAATVDISEIDGETFIKALEVNITIDTSNTSFEEIKSLYCDKPLSFYDRPLLENELSDEDKEDIKNALESHKESGSTKLDDFKKELGL